jgi:predicted deoxyguanosinetriphosphate triphosphohydrolase
MREKIWAQFPIKEGKGYDFLNYNTRIVLSDYFRRLTYKTQIFYGRTFPEMRTRLTHSIEVAHIADSIAKKIKTERKPKSTIIRLNLGLIQCIAHAHDFGHPPFAHAGERALDKLLNQCDKIKWSTENEGKVFSELTQKKLRFLHPLQSKMILFRGVGISGLNSNKKYKKMECAIIDGVVNHEIIRLSPSSFKGLIEKLEKNQSLEFLIKYYSGVISNGELTAALESETDKTGKDEFIDLYFNEPRRNKFKEFIVNVPTSIEGQIVQIADRIAYTNHDLDDAYKCKQSKWKDEINKLASETLADNIKEPKIKVIFAQYIAAGYISIDRYNKFYDTNKDKNLKAIIPEKVRSLDHRHRIEGFIDMVKDSNVSPKSNDPISLSPEFILAIAWYKSKMYQCYEELRRKDQMAEEFIKMFFQEIYNAIIENKTNDKDLQNFYEWAKDLEKIESYDTGEEILARVKKNINCIHKGIPIDDPNFRKREEIVRVIADYIVSRSEPYLANWYAKTISPFYDF